MKIVYLFDVFERTEEVLRVIHGSIRLIITVHHFTSLISFDTQIAKGTTDTVFGSTLR